MWAPLLFPVVKLLDWQQRWSELEADPNPFACVVMAQLAAKSERDPHRRKEAKLRLTRLLLDRGYGKDETRALIRIMDWIVNLPEDLDKEYVAEAHVLGEEYKMPFVTSFERVGNVKGRQEHAIETLLWQIELKFGEEAREAYQERVEHASAEELQKCIGRIAIVDRLEDVFSTD